MKKAICAILAGTMLLTLCACGTKKTETSASPSPAASESTQPTASASASPAVSPADNADAQALTGILDQISSGMEVGTAGSSLKAAKYAAALLDWGMATKLTKDQIKSAVVAWLSPKGNDAQTNFATQYTAVKDSVTQVTGDNGKSLLDDAGVTGSKYPWNDAAYAAVDAVTEAVLGQS